MLWTFIFYLVFKEHKRKIQLWKHVFCKFDEEFGSKIEKASNENLKIIFETDFKIQEGLILNKRFYNKFCKHNLSKFFIIKYGISFNMASIFKLCFNNYIR